MSQTLAKHNAGIEMIYSQTDPEELARAVLANVGRPVSYTDIDIDGARRAAHFLCDLLAAPL